MFVPLYGLIYFSRHDSRKIELTGAFRILIESEPGSSFLSDAFSLREPASTSRKDAIAPWLAARHRKRAIRNSRLFAQSLAR